MSGRKTETQGFQDGLSPRPKNFRFFYKPTGAQLFEVEAAPDGGMPVEQTASLMAIHCVARGIDPEDLSITIVPEEDLLGLVLPIVKQLVEASAIKYSLALSRRQLEVLRELSQNQSNKAIASKLNISQRTVKFHVSTLLKKFCAHNRQNLVLRAANLLPADATAATQPTPLTELQPLGPERQRAQR